MGKAVQSFQIQGYAMSPKTWEIVSRVYVNVEVALSAILFAFVIYFIAFVMPHVSDAENEAFCEKLDLKRGTNKYNQCLLDIGQFRLNAEKRVIDFVY
jgi:hypothetical protein